MNCPVCQSKNLIRVFEKPFTPVWTGVNGFFEDYSRECFLDFCRECTHIFHFPGEECMSYIGRVYQSAYSCGSTQKGVGNFGRQIALDCMRYLEPVPKKNGATLLEVGCANGHLLNWFLDRGFSQVTGMDPCAKNFQTKNIRTIQGFADRKTNLEEQWDAICTTDVLEHVISPADFLDFCFRHLCEDGTLYLTVPNFERLLLSGDPALFMHQHLQCFSKYSLGILLERCGFVVESWTHTVMDEYLVARKQSKNLTNSNRFVALDPARYGDLLELILSRIVFYWENSKKTGGRIIFHGVNSTLNNVLAWTGIRDGFELADNDELKIGKSWFGTIVKKPEEFVLEEKDLVLVVTSTFEKEIARGWMDLKVPCRVESMVFGRRLNE